MARSYYNQYSYLDYLSFPNIHLCFFVVILFFIVGFTWYMTYESVFEDLINQVKLFCLIVPLLVLIILYCLSSGGVSFLIPFQETDSIHRAGGSPCPWGVALLLIFLFFVISYQSSSNERWFPFINRS